VVVAGNEEFLRDKAKLLIARERELLSMRRKHKRLALWLSLAQRLAELVDAKSDFSEVCRRVAERMVAALDLHIVAFLEVAGGSLRTIARPGGAPEARGAIELPPAAAALITEHSFGTCLESAAEAQAALSHAVGLHRFLWQRMDPAGGPSVLFVAGYDRERAQFYAPFDEDDLAHFTNTAHQLALLIGNSNLVRELERDKRILREFNVELERRVDERTGELAATNRELEHALESLRQKDSRLAEDIEQARTFQEKILAPMPRSLDVDFASAYRPLESVGGDVFDAYQAGPGRFRIFLADATGHGVQASMRTFLIKAEYDRLKIAHHAPHALLQELNGRLAGLFPAGEILCTGCCVDVAIDRDGGATITYANAGNPPLLHWNGGALAPIHGDAPLLGIGDPTWPDPEVFRILPGDLLVIASDGLTEQRGPSGIAFEDTLRTGGMPAPRSAADGVDWLLRAFDAFRGDTPLADDVTLVALRLCGALSVTGGR
jgi:serine phosphatase RsbU (regulator of sigma subunit)